MNVLEQLNEKVNDAIEQHKCPPTAVLLGHKVYEKLVKECWGIVLQGREVTEVELELGKGTAGPAVLRMAIAVDPDPDQKDRVSVLMSNATTMKRFRRKIAPHKNR